MKRVHLIISGDVQGVGYRAWMRAEARRLNIVGWVKNRDDGAVEALCEGEQEALEELVGHCRKGPDVAWVKDVSVVWETAKDEFVSFSITF